jgi:pullulanase/glycogen debranching enzyme
MVVKAPIAGTFAALLVAHAAGAQDAALRAACDAPAHAQTLVAAPADGPAGARAVWLTGTVLRWPAAPASGTFALYHSADGQVVAAAGAAVRGADGAIPLAASTVPLPAAVRERFAWAGDGVELAVPASDTPRLRDLHRGQLVLVREDAQRRVQAATGIQAAGALDDLYAAAVPAPALGASIAGDTATYRLWAPTARAVALCAYADDASASIVALPLARDEATGIWQGARPGALATRYYAYLVDVFVPRTGIVRNRATDPWALGLGANSRRAWIADLRDPALEPEGRDDTPAPDRVAAATDLVIYELHVRDFSANDRTVPEPERGKYLAFTEAGSDGMRHLARLSDAGVTDVHLLPVFDLATVPETGCVTPAPSGAPDGESQQATVEAVKAQDCFNWGYDPLHYTVPEGSYASNASDGATRIVEFRRMVQALHRAGLRVGMDVVYNHTSASGQAANSVLDRVVPGYYHRLDAEGVVTTSTCCANTATENAMMERLMIDSAVAWARDYRIDSFRFDLMGHQPRAAMERLQAAVDAASGRRIHLLGEGWNFGEVANGARFVQASQLSLNGSGIATFSDRGRDALRGGGCCDSDSRQVSAQGWLNGLVYDPNASAPPGLGAADLMRAADLVRVALAGSLLDYRFENRSGQRVTLSQVDYGGQPGGYVREPGEVVNYVENHDNQTLFDLNAFKLPQDTSREDRARVQVLGAAAVLFSQGIAYLHAGQEILRSKSMDRNSYDSGDWFNRVDWSLRDTTFGSGLPPRQDNAASWPLMRPRLSDPRIAPAPAEIRWTRDAVLALLRIRSSTTLFRLRTAADVSERLTLLNTGPNQVPSVVAGHLRGDGYPGARYRQLVYAINADKRTHALVVPGEAGKTYVLHPVQRTWRAADRRPWHEARYDPASGTFTLPARSAVVFVVEKGPRL